MTNKKQFDNTYIISTDSQSDVLAELTFESFGVFFFQSSHVVSNVLAEDVGTVNFSVEDFGFSAVAGETFD